MKRSIGMIIAALAATVIGALSLATPAMASTQTVGFRTGSWHCSNGVYGISRVVITGTSSAPNANGDKSFTWNTQTASLPINGIPASGGSVQVTITYHCKVWTIFGWQPGYGEPASGTRWVYGSGVQPTYTL